MMQHHFLSLGGDYIIHSLTTQINSTRTMVMCCWKPVSRKITLSSLNSKIVLLELKIVSILVVDIDRLELVSHYKQEKQGQVEHQLTCHYGILGMCSFSLVVLSGAHIGGHNPTFLSIVGIVYFNISCPIV